MRFYPLVLGILGVWRVTHLLNAEDGPWNLLVRFRSRMSSSWIGALLDCFYCLSLWMALPFAYALAETWRERVLVWLAFSAGAILLERFVPDRMGPVRAEYWEDTEVQHGMLREGQDPSDKRPQSNQ